MKAIEVVGSGKDATLRLGAAPDPRPAPGEVLIDVAATAVNRADLLQRRGFYPPPPGASTILGLECSGTIAELGPGVTGWRVGDRICALLPGKRWGMPDRCCGSRTRCR
jgi:NADPH2:quinone reductase